jgi:hypothetical protein
MFDILLKSFVAFLVVYTIIHIIINMYKSARILLKRSNKNEGVYIVITVKDQEETIEGRIRSIVWKGLNNPYCGVTPNVLVVDMGSTDDTLEILNRLRNEYDFMKVTNKEEYAKILEEMIKGT